MQIPDRSGLLLSLEHNNQAGVTGKVDECPASLLALDSLLPVVQSLPGLTRTEKGLYYTVGCHRIPAVDRETFNELAKRVGELTIQKGGHAELSPQVFGILAQLQDSNLPLFPSLYRLRVTGFSTALDFLHLFLTPSLTTLEFDTIPVDSHHYPLILDFLEAVACEALDIKDVILGPGAIPDGVLNTCMKFRGIRRLELSSTTLLITLHDLEQIGSLERLEYLVLHAPLAAQETLDKVSDFSAPQPVPTEEQPFNRPFTQTSAFGSTSYPCGFVNPPNFFGIRAEQPSPPLPQRSPSPSLWSRCASPDVVPSILHDEHDANQPGTRITNDTREQSNQPQRSLFPTLKQLTVSGNPKFVGNLLECVSSPDLRELYLIFTSEAEDESIKVEPNSNKPKKKKGARSLVPTFTDVQVAPNLIISTIKSSTKKWVDSLGAVKFCTQGSAIPTISFPTNILENLLLCPQIEGIEIADFDVDSVDTALHSLKELPASKLKVLHLPIHTAASGISLSRLRFIALHCPQLVSLRCRFKHLSNVPTYDAGPDPLSHQLEILTVANAEPHQDRQRLPQIARYLDSLFPNLQAIETRNEPGFNGEQWQCVFDLIKLFQGVRSDEKYREGKTVKA